MTENNIQSNIYSIEYEPMQILPLFRILFVLKGGIHVSCTNMEYDLYPGDVFVVNFNETHGIKSEGENIVLTLHFNPYPLENKFPHLSYYWFTCDSFKSKLKDEPELRRLREMLLELDSLLDTTASHMPSDAENLLTDLVNHLTKHYQNFSFGGGEMKYGRMNVNDELAVRRIFEVQEYIFRHFKEKILLEDIANHLFLNKYYVSRLIKQFIGLNLKDLIGMIRTEKAQILLLTTKAPVNEIAYECGFAKPQSFIETFRQWYGVTPAEYRRNVISETEQHQAVRKELDSALPAVMDAKKLFADNWGSEAAPFKKYSFQADPETSFVDFEHGWEEEIFLSDLTMAAKFLTYERLSEYRRDLKFQRVVLQGLFESYRSGESKVQFWQEDIARLLGIILRAGLDIRIEIVPTEENAEDILASADDVIWQLTESAEAFHGKSICIVVSSAVLGKKGAEKIETRIADLCEGTGLSVMSGFFPFRFRHAVNTAADPMLIADIISSTIGKSAAEYPHRELLGDLVGSHGEKKTAYHAWTMISSLGKKMGFHSDGIIVTKKREDFYILLYDPRKHSPDEETPAAGLTFRMVFAHSCGKYSLFQTDLDYFKDISAQLIKIGSPKRLTEEDVQLLCLASQPQVSCTSLNTADGSALNISLSPYSAKLVVLRKMNS